MRSGESPIDMKGHDVANVEPAAALLSSCRQMGTLFRQAARRRRSWASNMVHCMLSTMLRLRLWSKAQRQSSAACRPRKS